MIDLHSHILPAVDDGAPAWEESLAMARVATADGITTIAATPHVNFQHHYPLDAIATLTAELNLRLREADLALEVVSGGEIALSRLVDLGDDELRTLGLGGGTTLLVESPYSPSAGALEPALFDLQLRGFRPLLAHPERCPYFQSDPGRLAQLVERGMTCSINAGSLEGSFGRTVQAVAVELLRRELVHAISSDAHDAEHRAPRLRAGIEAGARALPGLERLAGWLTLEAPRELLAGRPPPPRPEVPLARRGSLWRRLLG